MSMSQMSTRKVLTLVMPRRQNRVLLGMKKRGFGQGRLVFVYWMSCLTLSEDGMASEARWSRGKVWWMALSGSYLKRVA